jgi:hypothetical protein
MNKRGMEFLTQYIIAWVLVGFIVVSLILLVGSKRATVECIDGTFAVSKRECPQCVTNEHCGPDKQCTENKFCIAKKCKMDGDCDGRLSQCIYNQCMPSNADVPIG